MNNIEIAIAAEIKKQEELLERCLKSRFELKSYNGIVLMKSIDPKHNLTRYYYRNKSDPTKKRRYCNKNQIAKIRGIKQLHFIEEVIDRTEYNIKILDGTSKKLRSIQPADIDKSLPKVYQGAEGVANLFYEHPNSDEWLRQKYAEKDAYIKKHGQYKPEQLRHRAIDGTLCRSMGEVSIYNFLLQSGFTFIYEPVMFINKKLCLPDFLILCDDGTEIIVEHLGMADRHHYLARQDEKIEDYIHDNWIPNVNLFLTFNDYNGNINMEAIAWLITARVRK